MRYDTFEKVAGRTNIIGYIGKGNPTLLVACHLDVVPPGDGWDTDPFKSVVKNGRIFGRRANDNKGQMASMLVLAKFLKDNESRLNGSLLLIGSADEEKGIMAVGFGPGDEDQSHVANESIEIQELLDFGKIMSLVISDILK
ncbi:MAG: M20/M25/M40 family metallo-hydrolase [Candidatus Scalindua sp.]|nr:M20/M25/M40 family metallo-hydrolase [Candidatus Scalindua sp.]